MTKRQLNDKEKKIVNKNLEFIEEEKQYHDALIEQLELTIKNSDVIFKKQLRDKKAELQKEQEFVKEHVNAISILKDQLKNGVEEKNNKEDKKED